MILLVYIAQGRTVATEGLSLLALLHVMYNIQCCLIEITQALCLQACACIEKISHS
jgi:hypothetical protein